jgi:sirohydrochlorin ferrochelatase
MPYFLSAGRHVAIDVPTDIQQAIVEYPEVSVRILPYLGAHNAVTDLILATAKAG